VRPITPIFLLSLPRSGSTFVQRVLATHPQIATTGEPWILLPPLYSLRPFGVYAEYGHEWATIAIEDFCARLPRGAADYHAEVRSFALRLYARAATAEARYFLDKTPRYHLVIDELMELFPDARFIFLWRSPPAVVASIVESWGKGRWGLCDYNIDLYVGLANLVRAFERRPDAIHGVRYEDLIERPAETWPRTFAHLGLEFDQAMLGRIGEVALSDRVGDQAGTRRYAAPSREPLAKWQQVLTNPIRKAWCRRYLRWIGAERLRVMGYDLAALQGQLDATPSSLARVTSDPLFMLWDAAYAAFELRFVKDKYFKPTAVPRLTPHH
jgi:hypothetical protein